MGKDIGVSPELPALPGLVFTQGEHRLADHMRLYTLDTPPADTAGMTVLKSGQHIPEDFRHEQYLMIEENGKRILFSGCSHKGIVNIASHFEPDILIGGFHLMNVTDEGLLSQVADTLLQLPTTYYTGHCTGGPQYTFLKQRMGDRLHAISTGSVITL
jgi:7,8-dihydropterin-6-yl-methyl-4-(beta-D-ribofuranosyl)aminobenzene 5'-phosphate synthase